MKVPTSRELLEPKLVHWDQLLGPSCGDAQDVSRTIGWGEHTEVTCPECQALLAAYMLRIEPA